MLDHKILKPLIFRRVELVRWPLVAERLPAHSGTAPPAVSSLCVPIKQRLEPTMLRYPFHQLPRVPRRFINKVDYDDLKNDVKSVLKLTLSDEFRIQAARKRRLPNSFKGYRYQLSYQCKKVLFKS